MIKGAWCGAHISFRPAGPVECLIIVHRRKLGRDSRTATPSRTETYYLRECSARPNAVGRDMLHTIRRGGLVLELACSDDVLTSPRDMQAGASIQSAVSITKPYILRNNSLFSVPC